MESVIQQNVLLRQYTTLNVGGVADYFVTVTSVGEVKEALRFAREKATTPVILGGGSNVLIADGQLNILIIKNEIKGVTFQTLAEGVVLVKAGAGESWDDVVAQTVARGLTGLENLSGIPGTVGAAPVQNINAYGAMVAAVIDTVDVYDSNTDTVRVLNTADCHFGYRDSIFKQGDGRHLVVLAVTFKLAVTATLNLSYSSSSQSIKKFLLEKNITTPSVADVREAVLHVRSTIGMLLGQYNSAGSFFKNTVVSNETFLAIDAIVKKDFAEIGTQLMPWHWELPEGGQKIATAFLLECSPYNKNTYAHKAWKEVVGISPRHSLSIVTQSGATAGDVKEFVDEIKTSVKNIFGVTLETEVDYIAH